jgi:hypothetical protein
MESTFLFTVEDVFQVSGPRCILGPGISTRSGAPVVQMGVEVELRRPDGTSIFTKITGIAMYNPPLPQRAHLDVVVSNITKEEVPPGTKVYLLPRDGTDSD